MESSEAKRVRPYIEKSDGTNDSNIYEFIMSDQTSPGRNDTKALLV